MKSERSITRPLILALTTVMVIFWLLAIGLSIRVMQHEFDEIFDSAQQETTERLLALIIDDMAQGNMDDPRSVAILRTAANREYLTYQVRDASGKVVLRSNDASAEPFQVPLKTGFHDTDTARIYTERSADGSLFLQVADRFKNRREAVRESAATLLIPLIALIPASIFAVWFIVSRAMRPLDTLRQDIGTKDGGNLAPLAGNSLPKELRPIARSVNLLLDRLRAALEAEREFTANSAHELRTPIAGALAQTQRLAEELGPGQTQLRARQVETSLINLGRLAEKLLQLSRAEAGIGGSATPADLRPVLDMVVSDFERDSRSHGRLRYSAAKGATLTRNADMDAFGIVIRNLIENALTHGDPEMPVNVSLEGDGVIRVVNDGPAVREIDIQTLKKRFRRGKTTGAGSGLGLAIADRIVSQMGGTLELFSPASGEASGFEARIILPA
ncbi:HAMP domain-containing sensor histidine kinase [Rhizobium sp. S96]|uniref:sensor histidine kinase n=1 Tax=Rhizobium sp. S96 TaxID=3055140 RepID=UPI0025AA4DC5|nr:HAMP domain-containing sensor histidine kinase [Rhizobium sp. S96]MDM9620844.1 HAMP domain-containing sensor histidine kinase [Rhizobium sp. S96]